MTDGATIRLGGKDVARLGFGAMRLTGEGIRGPPADHDEAVRVLRRAVELGVTLIDTAGSSGPYVCEDLVREVLHDGSGYGHVVVATKAGLTRSGPDVWEPLARREHLRQCLLMAMRRLGLSQVSVEEIEAARSAGPSIASVQNRYDLGDRSAEDVLEHCGARGITFIPWAPVSARVLARPGGPLEEVKHRHEGASTAALALARLLQRSPVMVPIPGTSSVAHLEDNLAAAEITLTEEEVRTLADAT